MTSIFSRIKRASSWLFMQLNHHGGSASTKDEVDKHLSGNMRDANSEAKMGGPPMGGGGFFP